MGANQPKARCPSCRLWIDCSPGASKVPRHQVRGESTICSGSNKSPVETRGPGW
jgi:hypothetical protein